MVAKTIVGLRHLELFDVLSKLKFKSCAAVMLTDGSASRLATYKLIKGIEKSLYYGE